MLMTEFLRLIELLSNQVMMRIVGRLARLGDQLLFLGRVVVNAAWVLIHPRCDCRAWSGGLEACGDSNCQENAKDRVAGRAGERETSRVQDSRGKAVVHV